MNFERLIIGSIIAEPEAAGTACELVTPEMFTGIEKVIFSKIYGFTTEGKDVDIYLLSHSLSAELQDLNGVVYLMDMAKDIATASRLNEYCLELKQQYIARVLGSYFLQGSAMCEDKIDVQKIMEFAQSGMEKVFDLTTSAADGFKHISVIAENAVARADKRAVDRQQGKQIGVPSGIRPLDRLTNGWKGGQLIILAARPSAGKSAVMLSFAKNAAMAGFPACLYSLEMSSLSLADRMLMSMGDFDIDAYKSGEFEQWGELSNAQAQLSKLPIYIDDNAKVSMGYIRNHSRIMKQKGKCGIVFIDYLQLAEMGSTEKNRNREQEVAQTTRQCKILAKELDVPVILLSQLSRQVEGRPDKRPMLSDLRESGAIEQDADMVMFIYRADYYGIPDITLYDGQVISSKGVGELIIAKQRDGAVGDVAFRHNESMTQITNF